MSDLSHLLKESWALVEDRQDKLAEHLYARIFRSHPSLRNLFPVTMEVQRARILDSIVTLAQTIDDPERFDKYLRGLGRDHRRFEVAPEHYQVMGRALLETLRTFAGPQWSDQYEQAWTGAYAAIAERMIAAGEADSGPAYWLAEVIQHERRARDIAVFTCQPATPLPYHAGQYVSLASHYHPRLWRTYSIANAPRDDGTVDFHVRGRGTGVSAALVRRLRPGDTVRLGPPRGAMTLDVSSNRDLLCVAGGTGLAAIKAIVEELGHQQATRWVHLFFGARNRDELYDLVELYRLADRYPWLTLVPTCEDDPDFYGEHGRVSEVMRGHGPWEHHDVYVCGPKPMVNATLDTLAQLDVPQSRIRYDASTPW